LTVDMSLPPPVRVADLRGFRFSIVHAAMVVPALLWLGAFFLTPAAIMFSFSILTQPPSGDVGLPLTFSHYARLLGTPLYLNVLLVTLKVAALTALFAVVLGYPVALMIARGRPWISRLTTIIIIAPLVVSVVVRTYGWLLLLANNNAGVINWALSWLGFGPAAVRLLYSETAVVIGSLHVFLPMMVLPLASALSRINPALEDAAATLGASAWRAFWRVTVPLSMPGLVAGITMVFSLTAASFVTPAILGGNYGIMLGNLLEQQVMTVYDWPFGSAIAVVMVLVTFVVNGLSVWLLERRMNQRRRLSEAG
jgi:putative spermidine/putrescine transport system permease protein